MQTFGLKSWDTQDSVSEVQEVDVFSVSFSAKFRFGMHGVYTGEEASLCSLYISTGVRIRHSSELQLN